MTDAVQASSAASVLIVIVNYRTAQLVVECLRSLSPEIAAYPGVRVAVVDNASGDDSLRIIGEAIAREHWQDWATLMPSPTNGGYAYGNNYAIRPALQSETPPDYYWLLNPDTRVYPGALQSLLTFMQDHPKVGICGSSFEEANGEPWKMTFRFPSILGELEGGLRLGIATKLLARWSVARWMDDEPAAVDWLPGASMMIRQQVFDSIGLMDEGYFLYFEETDFCLQAHRAGWECWYVPESRVMHIAGQSTGVTVRTDQPKRLPQYWFDSRRRYFVKNHGRFYTAIADFIWMVAFLLWRGRRLIQRKPDTDPPQMLKDFLRNSAIFKAGVPEQSLST